MSTHSTIKTFSEIIGNTPVLNITGLVVQDATNNRTMLAKLENMNPFGTIYDRIAKAIYNVNGLHNGKRQLITKTKEIAICLNSLIKQSALSKGEFIDSDVVTLFVEPDSRSNCAEEALKCGVQVVSRIEELSTERESIWIDLKSGQIDIGSCIEELAEEITQQCGGELNTVVIPVETEQEQYIAQYLASALRKNKVNLIGIKIGGKQSDVGGLSIRCVDHGNALETLSKLEKVGVSCSIGSAAAVYAAATKTELVQAEVRGTVVAILTSKFGADSQRKIRPDEIDTIIETTKEKFRSATIEDMQLNFAVSVSTETTLQQAHEIMVINEFSHLPVTNAQRALIGYISYTSVSKYLSLDENHRLSPVSEIMYKFNTNSPQYSLITIDTTLVDLALFFKANRNSVAFVTDDNAKFCLGVVCPSDLVDFIS